MDSVKKIILIYAIAIVVGTTLLSISIYRITKTIEKHGLKSIVTQIWEGKK